MPSRMNAPFIRPFPVQNRWCVHSYYTISPYAPDGSGRLLLAGADLDRDTGEVLVLSKDGEVMERFGEDKLTTGFYHTGRWQTWSPDARFVYYQSGSMRQPRIVRRELATGEERSMEGDMEGAPPFGEPILSGLLGMLYAAGYGDGMFKPEEAPVPFLQRERHGLFRCSLEDGSSKLVLSTAEILASHPHKLKLMQSDQEMKARWGDGLTLMAYCARWSPDGERVLFFFGNHCVDRRRGEPRLTYIFTADRELKEIHLALDLSYGVPGLHWSWQPDGEMLVGYGPDPDDGSRLCLAEVRYDGTRYRKISSHNSGGHPSVSPANANLLVTDDYGIPGEISFIDKSSGEILRQLHLPRTLGDVERRGRNRYRVCLHPTFSRDGSKLLVNTLDGKDAVACEIDVEQALGM
ncbi:hypothetical protein [Paenibacillus sp. HB172176]|uniref:hypothetical protein n=1 Tax=Paenibacillus sp. HB172176 TaxID=2493690 RepID=UPI001438FA7F|nr:hypothetical protein [Paenibacillus sp. HB172176]